MRRCRHLETKTRNMSLIFVKIFYHTRYNVQIEMRGKSYLVNLLTTLSTWHWTCFLSSVQTLVNTTLTILTTLWIHDGT